MTHNRGRNCSQRHGKIPTTPSRTPSNDISRSPGPSRAPRTATASSPTTAVIATASQFERGHVIVIVTISDSSSVHRGRRSLQQTTATVSDVASIPTPAVDSELSPLTFQNIGVTEQNHRHAIDRDDVSVTEFLPDLRVPSPTRPVRLSTPTRAAISPPSHSRCRAVTDIYHRIHPLQRSVLRTIIIQHRLHGTSAHLVCLRHHSSNINSFVCMFTFENY